MSAMTHSPADSAGRGPAWFRAARGLLRRVLSLGIREDTPGPEAKRIWLTNFLTVASIVMCLPAIGYAFMQPSPAGGLLGLSLIVFSAVLLLNHRGRLMAARVTFLAVGQIMILASSALLGHDSYTHMTALCAIAATWMMFGYRNTKSLIFGCSASVLTAVSVELGVGEVLHAATQPEWLVETMRINNFVISSGVVALVLGVMASANHKQEVELRAALDELSDRELRLSTIMRHAAVALVSTDINGVILSANDEAERMFGRRAIELIGTQIRTLVPGFVAGTHECESIARYVDGKSIPVHVAVRRIGTNGDRRLIGVLRDLTREREHERALRELADLSRTAGMAEVATDVIHNIGNILNSVITNATVAAEIVEAQSPKKYRKLAHLLGSVDPAEAPWLTTDPQGSKVVPYLSAIAERVELDRGSVLDELRQLRSHVEHIKRVVQAQQELAGGPGILDLVAPAEVLDEAILPFERRLQQMDVAIIREYAAAPSIVVDRHRLQQILVNLIKNSLEAMQEAGGGERHELVLRVEACPLGVRFVVADSGCGIPQEVIDKVFQHGFTTKRHGHGFGLHGCAISATAMGGELQAQSDGPNRGASFFLELPVEPPKADDDAQEVSA